jgi:hypothetical protein
VTYLNAFHVAPSTNLRFSSIHCRRRATTIPHRLPTPFSTTRSSSFALHMSEESISQPDPLIVDTSEVLGRVSWLSWWAQMILSVIASVTLMFARNVTTQSSQLNPVGSGFFLAGAGIITSFVSIFWTWGAARLSRRFRRKPSTSRISAANMLRRAVKVGCTINLAGMFATLLGAEQIVGALAIKVLTQSGIQVTAYGQMPAQLQPLDILIVQANTNTLLSHFCSLVGYLWMVRFIHKLDPPSVKGDVRK